MGEFIKVGGSSSSDGGATSYAGLSDKTTVDLPVVNTPLATVLSGKENVANKKTDVDANKTSDTFFPSVKAVFDWVSGLFARGAASSTNNAIARFDGATGKQLQNSVGTIDDAGNIVTSGQLIAASGVFNASSITGGANQFSLDYLPGTGGGRLLAWGADTSTPGEYSIIVCSSNAVVYMPVAVAKAVAGSARLQIVNQLQLGGALIDTTGSSGVNGQVLKNVGGFPVWSNP